MYEHALKRRGAELTDVQAAQLEADLRTDPSNFDAHIMLLRKYSSRRSFDDDAARSRINHIAWLIRYHPDCPTVGEDDCWLYDVPTYSDDYPCLRKLWLQQIDRHKFNTDVLSNAARALVHSEPALAERCLLLALRRKPKSSQLRRHLSHVYSLWEGHEQRAFEQLSINCQGEDSEDLLYDLSDLPKVALAAGRIDAARAAANRLVQLAGKYSTDPFRDNAIHKAHTALGRIALKEGDIQAACFHLARSMDNVLSRQITAFLPSLELVKELVAAGISGPVLSYLDQYDAMKADKTQSSFELRYQAEHGAGSHELNEDQFKTALLDHEYNQLAQMVPPSSTEIASAIELTTRSMTRYSRALAHPEQLPHPSLHANYTNQLKRLETHLARLHTLGSTARPNQDK